MGVPSWANWGDRYGRRSLGVQVSFIQNPPDQDLRWTKWKFNSCFQVHPAKGGRRLWSGCHFWSQGEGQLKTSWKLLCCDSQSESKFDNFFQRSRWWATGTELVLTQTSPLSLWGAFDIWAFDFDKYIERKIWIEFLVEETNLQTYLENKNTISGLPVEWKQSSLPLRSSPSKSLETFYLPQTANN